MAERINQHPYLIEHAYTVLHASYSLLIHSCVLI